MATGTDQPGGVQPGPGVTGIAQLQSQIQFGMTPEAWALHRIADEIKLLRETIHDAIAGELIEP